MGYNIDMKDLHIDLIYFACLIFDVYRISNSGVHDLKISFTK